MMSMFGFVDRYVICAYAGALRRQAVFATERRLATIEKGKIAAREKRRLFRDADFVTLWCSCDLGAIKQVKALDKAIQEAE